VKWLWNYPLRHGPGFFLGVEVAPGFYTADGRRWLKRYRAAVLLEHLVEALALAAILAFGRWSLLPVWAGGGAVFLTSVFFGFTAYARAKLGANPPVRSSAAVSLDQRRLGAYISWPAEILLAVMIALSWGLLLVHKGAHVHWNVPVLLTYMIVALLPYKIQIVRWSFPLPTERIEEHARWIEAQRRAQLRVIDGFFRWFPLVILAGYALGVGWTTARTKVWLPWLVIGIALVVLLVYTAIMIRGAGRLTDMARDLRPVGSWSTPFRPAGRMPPSFFSPYFAVYFAGLVLLLVFFRH
jgi:hypothetical protein